MKENMYYGASHFIFQRAEELRNRMTPAEEILWKHLRINEWKLKFRRQHPIWNYIADFYCHKIKLLIELDGEIHENEEVKTNDAQREEHLREFGLTVLRFKNEEIFKHLSSVIKKITETVELLRNTPLADGGKKLYVIKIGGNIVDDDAKLTSFLVSFATIKEHKILVHGGGKVATKIGDLLGIESKYVDGRRITDAATIDLVTMVYAGLINKKIVAQLQQHSCNALGVTGADGNLIPAVKRPVKDIDYGLVGDVKSEMVNPGSWSSLINSGFTPVAAPITHDENGQLLNTNADTIAQEVAKALSKAFEVSLIFSFEKSGVLLDVNNESSLIKVMSQEYYSELREKGSIFAGMIPKLDNAFSALKSGVKKVVIGKAENLHALIEGSDGTSIIHE